MRFCAPKRLGGEYPGYRGCCGYFDFRSYYGYPGKRSDIKFWRMRQNLLSRVHTFAFCRNATRDFEVQVWTRRRAFWRKGARLWSTSCSLHLVGKCLYRQLASSHSIAKLHSKNSMKLKSGETRVWLDATIHSCAAALRVQKLVHTCSVGVT
jgi:hypothetical protein